VKYLHTGWPSIQPTDTVKNPSEIERQVISKLQRFSTLYMITLTALVFSCLTHLFFHRYLKVSVPQNPAAAEADAFPPHIVKFQNTLTSSALVCPISFSYRFSKSQKAPTVNNDILSTAVCHKTWVSWCENVSVLDFVGIKVDGGAGDNWSYKTCKAPVKSSPSTNQHPTFYRPDAIPVAQPTVSKH